MKEKTVSDAVNFRRSVRVYDPEKTIDTEKVKKCIEQATLAPSSSNLQLWEFYHIQSEEFLKEVAKVCYNQPAAKTAQELVIPVVRLDLWQQRIQAPCSLWIGSVIFEHGSPRFEPLDTSNAHYQLWVWAATA